MDTEVHMRVYVCVSLSRGGRVVLCAALEDLSELKIVELASTGHGRTSHHLINLHNRDSAREEVTSTVHICMPATHLLVGHAVAHGRQELSQPAIACKH